MTHVSVITVQPSINQQAVEAGRCCAMPPPAAGPLVQTTATTPAVIGAVDHAEWLSGLSPKSYRGGSKRKALTAFAADDEDFFSFLTGISCGGAYCMSSKRSATLMITICCNAAGS